MTIKLYPSTNVLVLDADGEKIGEMKSQEARAIAESKGLDLVPVSQQSSFVVCKIMDEGKYRYEQAKKEKQQKKKILPTKELRFHINTEQHDIDTKVNHAIKFLEKGHTVKLSVVMKGRDKGHVDLAKDKLAAIINSLENYGKADPIKVSSSSRSVVAVSVLQPARDNNVESNEK